MLTIENIASQRLIKFSDKIRMCSSSGRLANVTVTHKITEYHNSFCMFVARCINANIYFFVGRLKYIPMYDSNLQHK